MLIKTKDLKLKNKYFFLCCKTNSILFIFVCVPGYTHGYPRALYNNAIFVCTRSCMDTVPGSGLGQLMFQNANPFLCVLCSRQNYWEMKPKDTGQLDLLLHPNKPSVEKHMTTPIRQHTKERIANIHNMTHTACCSMQIYIYNVQQVFT